MKSFLTLLACVTLAGIPVMAAGDTPSAPASETPLAVTTGYGVDGLVLWLAADRGLTIDNQSRVLSLVDGTGNFKLVSPGSTAGPLYVPNALNGKPVFRFDRNRSLYSPDNFGTDLNGAMTIVMVAMTVGTADYQQFSLYLGQNATSHANRAFAYSKGLELFDGQWVGCYGKPMVKDSFVMTAAAINSSLTQTIFYRNGRQTLVSNLSDECKGANFADLSDGVTFGAATDPVCGWNGDIAEILVYDRQLSPAEIQAVWSSLAQKYALQPTLMSVPPVKPAKH